MRAIRFLVDVAFLAAILSAFAFRMIEAAKLGALIWVGCNAMMIRIFLERPDRGCALRARGPF